MDGPITNAVNVQDDLGMIEAALRDYDRALRLAGPGYATVYYERGILSERLGRFSDAIADYRQGCQHGIPKACEALAMMTGR